jgi:hypothetical protein
MAGITFRILVGDVPQAIILHVVGADEFKLKTGGGGLEPRQERGEILRAGGDRLTYRYYDHVLLV